jgi:hypothetical protein
MHLKFHARCQNKSAPVSHMDLGKVILAHVHQNMYLTPDNYYCPRKSLVPSQYPDILCQMHITGLWLLIAQFQTQVAYRSGIPMFTTRYN